MRANLKEDIIANFTESGNTEVGIIPHAKKKVGLDRLRFDGRNIVDLADMSTIHVRQLGPGAYELHAIEVMNSRPVKMRYRDRKNLTTDSDRTIRVMTEEEVTATIEAERVQRLKNRKNRALKELLDKDFAYKLLFALIIYARTQNSQIGTLFDELRPIIADIYDLPTEKEDIKDTVNQLKQIVERAATTI